MDDFDLDMNFDDPSDSFDIEGPKQGKRKAVSSVATNTTAALKAGTFNIGKNVSSSILNSMPVSSSLLDDASMAKDQLADAFSDTREEVAKAVIVGKKALAYALPKTKRYIPKKLYGKLEQFSKVEKDSGYVKKSETEQAQEATQQTIEKLFSTVKQFDKEQLETKTAEKFISDIRESAFRKRVLAALYKLNEKSTFNIRYASNTATPFMKKSLEVGMMQLFFAKQQHGTLKVIAELLDKKLEAIITNTSLPEVAKIKLNDKFATSWRVQTMDAASRSIADYAKKFVGQYRSNILGNISQLSDMGGQGIEMLEQAEEMGLGADEKGKGGKFVGGMIGNKISPFISRALLEPLKPFTRSIERDLGMVRSYIRSGARDIREKLSSSSNTLLQTVGQMMPITTPYVEIGNNLLTNVDEAVPFDKLTRQSIVEIIPKWLSKIATNTRNIYEGRETGEEVYNVVKRRITSVEEAKHDFMTYKIGDVKSRSQGIKEAMGIIKGAIGTNSQLNDTHFDFSKDDILRLVDNMVANNINFQRTLFAKYRYVTSEDDIDMNEMRIYLEGVKNPVALLRVIGNLIFHDGEYDNEFLALMQRAIETETSKKSVRNEMPSDVEKYGFYSMFDNEIKEGRFTAEAMRKLRLNIDDEAMESGIQSGSDMYKAYLKAWQDGLESAHESTFVQALPDAIRSRADTLSQKNIFILSSLAKLLSGEVEEFSEASAIDALHNRPTKKKAPKKEAMPGQLSDILNNGVIDLYHPNKEKMDESGLLNDEHASLTKVAKPHKSVFNGMLTELVSIHQLLATKFGFDVWSPEHAKDATQITAVEDESVSPMRLSKNIRRRRRRIHAHPSVEKVQSIESIAETESESAEVPSETKEKITKLKEQALNQAKHKKDWVISKTPPYLDHPKVQEAKAQAQRVMDTVTDTLKQAKDKTVAEVDAFKSMSTEEKKAQGKALLESITTAAQDTINKNIDKLKQFRESSVVQAISDKVTPTLTSVAQQTKATHTKVVDSVGRVSQNQSVADLKEKLKLIRETKVEDLADTATAVVDKMFTKLRSEETSGGGLFSIGKEESSDKYTPILTKIHDAIVSCCDNQMLAFETLTNAVMASGAGVMSAASDGEIKPKTGWTTFWKSTGSVAKKVVGTYGGMAKGFYKGLFGLGKHVIPGVAKGVGGVAKGTGAAIGGIGKGIGNMLPYGKKFAKAYLGTIGNIYGGAFKAVGRIGAAMFQPPKIRGGEEEPFVDVYKKDQIEPGNPLVKASVLREYGVKASGAKLNACSDIDGPILHSKTGQTLISKEDFEQGLVDIHGKSIFASKSIGRKFLKGLTHQGGLLGMTARLFDTGGAMMKAMGPTIKNIAQFYGKFYGNAVSGIGKGIGNSLGWIFNRGGGKLKAKALPKLMKPITSRLDQIYMFMVKTWGSEQELNDLLSSKSVDTDEDVEPETKTTFKSLFSSIKDRLKQLKQTGDEEGETPTSFADKARGWFDSFRNRYSEKGIGVKDTFNSIRDKIKQHTPHIDLKKIKRPKLSDKVKDRVSSMKDSLYAAAGKAKDRFDNREPLFAKFKERVGKVKLPKFKLSDKTKNFFKWSPRERDPSKESWWQKTKNTIKEKDLPGKGGPLLKKMADLYSKSTKTLFKGIGKSYGLFKNRKGGLTKKGESDQYSSITSRLDRIYKFMIKTWGDPSDLKDLVGNNIPSPTDIKNSARTKLKSILKKAKAKLHSYMDRDGDGDRDGSAEDIADKYNKRKQSKLARLKAWNDRRKARAKDTDGSPTDESSSLWDKLKTGASWLTGGRIATSVKNLFKKPKAGGLLSKTGDLFKSAGGALKNSKMFGGLASKAGAMLPAAGAAGGGLLGTLGSVAGKVMPWATAGMALYGGVKGLAADHDARAAEWEAFKDKSLLGKAGAVINPVNWGKWAGMGARAGGEHLINGVKNVGKTMFKYSPLGLSLSAGKKVAGWFKHRKDADAPTHNEDAVQKALSVPPTEAGKYLHNLEDIREYRRRRGYRAERPGGIPHDKDDKYIPYETHQEMSAFDPERDLRTKPVLGKVSKKRPWYSKMYHASPIGKFNDRIEHGIDWIKHHNDPDYKHTTLGEKIKNGYNDTHFTKSVRRNMGIAEWIGKTSKNLYGKGKEFLTHTVPTSVSTSMFSNVAGILNRSTQGLGTRNYKEVSDKLMENRKLVEADEKVIKKKPISNAVDKKLGKLSSNTPEDKVLADIAKHTKDTAERSKASLEAMNNLVNHVEKLLGINEEMKGSFDKVADNTSKLDEMNNHLATVKENSGKEDKVVVVNSDKAPAPQKPTISTPVISVMKSRVVYT